MESPSKTIEIWNPRTRSRETERVYGEGALRWMYETTLGQALGEAVLTGKLTSRLYGAYNSSRLSQRKIAPFIQAFRIDMDEYEPGPFRTFNEFFIRPFKPGRRSFPSDPETLGAPAEGRYFAFENLAKGAQLPVKGIALDPARLLGGEEEAKPFLGGSAWIARLCPVDYHRYHYPDDGRTVSSYPLHGPLHSVNPVALEYKSDILIENERRVAILETRNLGRLAYVEVGAVCVGRIEQTHPENESFSRGQEKGYFLFGGSTVVLLAEREGPKPTRELLEKSSEGIETLIRLGEPIGLV